MATDRRGLLTLAAVSAMWVTACSAGSGQTTTGGLGSPLVNLGARTGPTTTATIPNPCEIDIDFGGVPVGETASAVIEVADVGSAPLDLTGLQSVAGPGFAVTYSTPLIQPGGSTEVSATFQPIATGPDATTVEIQTNGINNACPAPTSAVTIQLTGVGLGFLSVEPAEIDFGNIILKTTATKSVTVTNTSAATVNGFSATVGGGDQNLFTLGAVPTTLAAGASTQVEITYAPLALETRSVATVLFAGSGGGNATLTMFGEPLGVALTLSPNPIDFGLVALTATAVGCTTVTNHSSVLPVNVEAVIQFDTDGGIFAQSQLDDSTPPMAAPIPVTIDPGDSAEVCFSFTPSIAQQYGGQATLETNDPSHSDPIVQLVGLGGGPLISCSPTSLDFSGADGGSTGMQSVLCTNTGTVIPNTVNPNANLTVGQPIARPSAFSAQFDPEDPYPDGGLAPGQSTKIDVTYQPNGAALDGGDGGEAGTLTIPNNGGPKQAPVVIPLSS